MEAKSKNNGNHYEIKNENGLIRLVRVPNGTFDHKIEEGNLDGTGKKKWLTYSKNNEEEEEGVRFTNVNSSQEIKDEFIVVGTFKSFKRNKELKEKLRKFISFKNKSQNAMPIHQALSQIIMQTKKEIYEMVVLIAADEPDKFNF